DRAVQAVDLVDEKDVVAFEARQDRRHVALALERGTGDAADADAELLAHDVRQARLAEARRTDEQHVGERFLARPRSPGPGRELVLDSLLADELQQPARTQRLLEVFLVRRDCRRKELRVHVTLLSTPAGPVPPAAAPDRPLRALARPRRRSSRARPARRARRDAAAFRLRRRSARVRPRASP